MKHAVRRFKTLAICLKEIEPFVRDGQHLLTGKPFKQFGGMRSREILANWLICASANFEHGAERLCFTSDPNGSDGMIYDLKAETAWPTEHIMVPRLRAGDSTTHTVETKIVNAVKKKQLKGGSAYASGKQLVVFLDLGGGEWHPNKVAKQLPTPLLFDDVWIVCLQQTKEGKYTYGITQLNSTQSLIWLVHIDESFTMWKVEKLQ